MTVEVFFIFFNLFFFAPQPENLTADRFVVYGDHYVNIREAMTRTLAANPNELKTALEVSFISYVLQFLCVRCRAQFSDK